MITSFNLGDRVILRKPHACGSNEWEITRTGADVKLKCINCSRTVMLDRLKFVRSVKQLMPCTEDVCGNEREEEKDEKQKG